MDSITVSFVIQLYQEIDRSMLKMLQCGQHDDVMKMVRRRLRDRRNYLQAREEIMGLRRLVRQLQRKREERNGKP